MTDESAIKNETPVFVENGYFDRVNTDLLKKIPISAKTIFEAGCGAGALASAYKKINPDCCYTGIELCADAANYALRHKRLDRIIIGSVEENDLMQLDIKKESLDCIIYGDILEHLLDPWELLKKHSDYLSNNGIVVASIPNISNFSIILQILKGQWNYSDEGLLDKTHLRFFTLSSINTLFTNAGYTIIDIQGSCYGMESHKIFMETFTPVINYLNIDKTMFNNTTAVFQYFITATKSSSSNTKSFTNDD